MKSTATASALDHVRDLVLSMPMARTLQLSFETIEPGATKLRAPVQDAWCFQPGHLQATAMFALADFAAVSAAATVLPPGWLNSTIDASVKFVGPAKGTHIVARGRVVQPGKSLTVCAADVFALDAAGNERLCATWLGTARNFNAAGTP